MTFRDILVRWTKLAVMAAVIGGLHALVHYNAEPIAKQLAPTYTPLTESEAAEMLPARVAGLKEEAQAAARRTCFYRFSEDFESCVNRAQKTTVNERELLSSIHANHALVYELSVVRPLALQLHEQFALGFAILYGLLALAAGWALTRWLMLNGRLLILEPPSKTSRRLIEVKGWRETHKLRRAAREFSDLESLHRNGLISDAVFNSRKAALKATLGASNEA